MIQISWSHGAAEASAFAALVPKALKSIDRWAETDGVQEMDEFGPYYDILIREGIKNPGNKRHHTLRPATLRLGAAKALQDAPDHWFGWHNEIEEIFNNLLDGTRMARSTMHDPIQWSEQTLDFMLQLAWFREVMFA
jgi:hypothetical protein